MPGPPGPGVVMIDSDLHLRFWILNVFASPEGGGNQLAVVESLARLESAAMQRIAADFNFSETTFFERPGALGLPVPVRIFTPNRELPFAGHPVLGTAEIIRREQPGPSPELVTLALGVGEVPVRFLGGGSPPTMTQQKPQFAPGVDRERAARLLSLGTDQVSASLASSLVSTGARFLVVPLSDRESVAGARLNLEEYERFARETDTLGIGIFAPETEDYSQVRCRVFAPGAGIAEDPATGSHAGCLGAFLASELGWSAERTVEIVQGVEMGRPSRLFVHAADGLSPRVGGFSTLWAEGRLPL